MKNADSTIPPALVELIFDPEGNRAEINILGEVRDLLAEGMPIRSVARGLAGALTTLVSEEYPKGNDEFLWAWHFLRELEQGFGNWRKRLDLIEDMADEIERSRATGGTGNPYQ